MSEPSSLYVRVRLTPAAYAAFLASPLALPKAYSDWRAWLDASRYHGHISDERIQAATHPEKATTVGDYLAETDAMRVLGIGSSYDPTTEIWLYRLIECSENYFDFLLILSVLRAVSRYKDLPSAPSTDDFILIYPFLWGGAAEAYLVITQGASYFREEIPAAAQQEADDSFQAMYAAISAQFNLDEQ